jgi:hypothetical protein
MKSVALALVAVLGITAVATAGDYCHGAVAVVRGADYGTDEVVKVRRVAVVDDYQAPVQVVRVVRATNYGYGYHASNVNVVNVRQGYGTRGVRTVRAGGGGWGRVPRQHHRRRGPAGEFAGRGIRPGGVRRQRVQVRSPVRSPSPRGPEPPRSQGRGGFFCCTRRTLLYRGGRASPPVRPYPAKPGPWGVTPPPAGSPRDRFAVG